MYKRVGCEVWTIEDRDCEYIKASPNRFRLYNFTFPKDIEVFGQIDIILEIEGIRYLGYLENISHITYLDDTFDKVNHCDFVVCQENYLEDREIIREREYVYKR